MSEKLLDMLSQKKTWEKRKPVEIKLEKGQVGITQKLTKSDGTYNIKALRERLRNKGLSVPKLFDSSQTIEGKKESKTESGAEKIEDILKPMVIIIIKFIKMEKKKEYLKMNI